MPGTSAARKMSSRTLAAESKARMEALVAKVKAAHDDEPPPFDEWLLDHLNAFEKRSGQPLTQQMLAKELGVSIGSVQGWLQGTRSPRYEHLFRLRNLFGPLPWE